MPDNVIGSSGTKWLSHNWKGRLYAYDVSLKLPDAIEAVYAEKKRLRKKYNGIIPEYYSKREQKHYATLTPTKKVRQSRY